MEIVVSITVLRILHRIEHQINLHFSSHFITWHLRYWKIHFFNKPPRIAKKNTLEFRLKLKNRLWQCVWTCIYSHNAESGMHRGSEKITYLSVSTDISLHNSNWRTIHWRRRPEWQPHKFISQITSAGN